MGRCPFHDDSSPSLVVTPGKNLWHCLGACAKGGGPIDWVMTAQGVSFRHAVELLAELALLTSRLPQLLRQVEDLLDDLVDHHQVRIVAGDHEGDPVAIAAITGHWLAASADAAHELAYRVDQAHQNLTWAAPTT